MKIHLFVFSFLMFCSTNLNLVSSQIGEERVTINVQQGTVRGKRTEFNQEGRIKRIYVFKGIPYAKPPIQEKRFKPPEEIEKFEGVIDVQESVSCPQLPMFSSGPRRFREDCLTMDIYALGPIENVKNPKPVVVYFPGGGHFRLANSADYGPKFLIDIQNQPLEMILVVVNYRVGALGFLSTQNSASAGNQGLLDQQMALKWINQNIRNFGGDNTKTTIFGHDSSAVAVSLHILNSESRRYFQQAALSGGSLYSPWAFHHHQDAWRHTHHLANRLGCNVNDKSETILNCLRSKKFEDILEEQEKYDNITFLPVLDTNFTEKPFFKNDPFKVLELGDYSPLPVMLGMVSEEGFQEYLKKEVELRKERNLETALSNYFKEFLFPGTVFDPHLHAYQRHQLEAAIKAIKYVYFKKEQTSQNNDEDDDDRTKRAWIEVISDFLYRSPVDKFAQKMSLKKNSTFAYSMEYPSPYTFRKMLDRSGGNFEKQSPIHMDDALYFFDNPTYENSLKANVPDENQRAVQLKTIRNAFIIAFAKFAKDGNPSGNFGSIKWESYGLNSSVLRVTNSSVSPANYNAILYIFEHRFRSFQLDLFGRLLPDLIPRNGSNLVYFEDQRRVVAYGALTWTFLVFLLLILFLAVGAFLIYRHRKYRREKGFESVSMHSPGEKVDLRV